MTEPLDQVNSASSSLPNVSGTPSSCRGAERKLASTTGTVLSCSHKIQREARKPAVQLAQHTENSTSSWSSSWYQRRLQSTSGTSTSRSSRSPSLFAACTVQELRRCWCPGRRFNLQAQSHAMSPRFRWDSTSWISACKRLLRMCMLPMRAMHSHAGVAKHTSVYVAEGV